MPLKLRFLYIFSFVSLVFFASVMDIYASEDKGFIRFIDNFYSTAKKRGISRKTYDRAFRGIRSPDDKTISHAEYQPEFRQQLWEYLATRVSRSAISKGREQARLWRTTLDDLEVRYGIPPTILLAIWSMETSYGEALKKTNFSIIHSLATLAYLDNRRSRFGKRQLLAALEMLEKGLVRFSDLQGSWAGAMGHTQFIPTSYLAYSRDGDGDGRSDIWRSVPDALASAANLLKTNGWRVGETWGYEVVVPASVRKLEGETMILEEWEGKGISRTRNRSFSGKSRKAVLHLPAGESGPSFLLLRNFYVLKTYNNADKYALAVGHLADRIAGRGAFAVALSSPAAELSEVDRVELQHELARHGYYDGEIDGKLGPLSRQAIAKAQKRLNLPSDGYASKKLLKTLKVRSP